MVWTEVFRSATASELDTLTGPLHDLTAPIATDFSIPRAIVEPLSSYVLRERPGLVVLSGPPLSGKTNVLAQLAKRWANDDVVVPLFVEASSLEAGVITTIAGLFTRHLFRSRAREAVRQWLATGLRAPGHRHLVVLVDGWTQSDRNAAELVELRQLVESSAITVLMALDTTTWKRLSRRPGRNQKTRMGRDAVEFDVERLTEAEVDRGQATLLNHGVVLQPGGSFHSENRQPHYLRVNAALAERTGRRHPMDDGIQGPPGAIAALFIPAVPQPETLVEAWDSLSDPETRSALGRLARAWFAQDIETFAPELRLYVTGRGAVLRDVALDVMKDDLGLLLHQGHVRVSDAPDQQTVILPTLPEHFAVACSKVLGRRLVELIDAGRPEDAWQELVLHSGALPHGELAGVLALMDQPEALTPAVWHGLRSPPKARYMAPGTRVLIQTETGNQIEHVLDEEDAVDPVPENHTAAMLLSHLAGRMMAGDDYSTDINLGTWWSIGSYNYPLLPARPHMQGVHVHHLDEPRGSYICEEFGVLEPLTYSMHRAIQQGQVDLEPLAVRAVDEARLFLALRIARAARASLASVEPEVVRRAEALLQHVDPFLSSALEKATHR